VLDPMLAILVPLCGGLVFGVASELIARWRPEREVDPIEANALHGGRMSLVGSIIVGAAQTWGGFFVSEVAMAIMYGVMAAVLVFRPWGLFGDEE
jgi:CIC family chloride channel protein